MILISNFEGIEEGIGIEEEAESRKKGELFSRSEKRWTRYSLLPRRRSFATGPKLSSSRRARGQLLFQEKTDPCVLVVPWHALASSSGRFLFFQVLFPSDSLSSSPLSPPSFFFSPFHLFFTVSLLRILSLSPQATGLSAPIKSRVPLTLLRCISKPTALYCSTVARREFFGKLVLEIRRSRLMRLLLPEQTHESSNLTIISTFFECV